MIEKYNLTISEIEDLMDSDGFSEFERQFPERCRRAKQFMFREDMLRCIGGGLLMNIFLEIEESDLNYGRFGKPYIRTGREFNISHSGDYVVMATADNPVGIDIEKPDPRHIDVAEHVFTDDELDWMSETADKIDSFYTLWTMKESLMKATGLGLNLPPASFSVMDGIRHGLLLHEGVRYEMHSIKIGDHPVAICVQVT